MIRVRRPAGGSGALFGLVIGLLVGLFVTVIALPKRQPTSVVAPSAGDAASGGDEVAAAGDSGSATAAPEGLGGGDATAGDGSATGSGGDTSSAPAGDGGAGGESSTASGADTGSTTTAPPTTAAATPGVAVRGISDKTIKIGAALADLGALKHLGPRFDNGNPREHWEAILADWKRKGIVPINGRDVEFVFTSYGVIDAAEQRAACIRLVQDHKVYAVVAQVYFYTGAECVAREFRTLLVTADGPADEVFKRSDPYLFSIGMSDSRLIRNLVQWAEQRGQLKGKDIGVYRADTPVDKELVERHLRPELAKFGYTVKTEMSTAQTLGGPQDSLAVQRFIADGIDVAFLFTSKTGFMQQAAAAGYKPTYLESDKEFGTSDTTTSTYPADHFDGTYGMTGRRVGETSAGMQLSAEGKECIAAFERHAGRKLQAETTEWSYVLTACDEAKILLQALKAPGRAITPQASVAALETLANVSMTRYANVTFRRGKHHGADSWRTVQWQKGCACWKAIGGFRPLFVP